MLAWNRWWVQLRSSSVRCFERYKGLFRWHKTLPLGRRLEAVSSRSPDAWEERYKRAPCTFAPLHSPWHTAVLSRD